jgi:preprotein translocase subunit SecA
MNDQRKVIFEQRREIMSSDDVSDQIAEFRLEVIADLVERHIPPKVYAEQWDAAGLQNEVSRIFGLNLPVTDWTKEEGIADEEVKERITQAVEKRAASRTVEFTPGVMRYAEKAILLQTLDHDWREHIVQLDHLRQYVGLRGYGQRDPLNEYKSDAFTLFEDLLGKMRAGVVQQLMHIQVTQEPPPIDVTPRVMHASHIDPLTGQDEMADGIASMGSEPGQGTFMRERDVPVDPNDPRTWGKVGRNSPCPCGSGRKFKQCHGALV